MHGYGHRRKIDLQESQHEQCSISSTVSPPSNDSQPFEKAETTGRNRRNSHMTKASSPGRDEAAMRSITPLVRKFLQQQE